MLEIGEPEHGSACLAALGFVVERVELHLEILRVDQRRSCTSGCGWWSCWLSRPDTGHPADVAPGSVVAFSARIKLLGSDSRQTTTSCAREESRKNDACCILRTDGGFRHKCNARPQAPLTPARGLRT